MLTTLPNAEVNNEWSYTSAPPLCQSLRISWGPLPSFLEDMKQLPAELTTIHGVCVCVCVCVRARACLNQLTYLNEVCYERNAITYQFITVYYFDHRT